MITPQTNIKKKRRVILRTAPDYLPESYRHRTSRIRITFRPTAGERRFFRKKEFLSPSKWAPLNRVVTYGPLEGSRWDNTFMPHMRGILDASVFPGVRYVTNKKVPQSGSSAGNETLLAWTADMDPGPVFVCYPDRETGKDRFRDYLSPVFTRSPRLRSLLTGVSDDVSSMRIKLQTALVYLAWSGSVTTLGNVSCRYLFLEELDKWVRQLDKKEADTLSLALERFRAYITNGKAFMSSTPSDPAGPITKMWQKADAKFEYYLPCPECGTMQFVSDNNIRFGEHRDPEEIVKKDLARFLFPCCGVLVDDRTRIKSCQQGVWYETNADGSPKDNPRPLEKVLAEDHPVSIAFTSPAWISPLFTHSEIAAAKLRATKDPVAAHYYDNQIRAVAHIPYRQGRKIDNILMRRDDRPEGLVPGNGLTSCLLAGVDTQDNGFFFDIRAYGWGMTQPSWGVRYGFIESLAALSTVLWETPYQDVDGLYYPILLAVIDSGGHRASEVYDFARQHPQQVAAYKGASGRRAQPYTKSVIDRYPGTKVPIPGGVDLYICDTHHYKDQLAGKLQIKPDDPGAFLFHADTDEAYAEQLCAEYVNERRLWDCPLNKANHYWDCVVEGQVAADIMGLKWMSNEVE
ncbi:MAG: terminase gpA endonuclease subunit [Kiritimatiellia bacterium]